jgi:ATP-binding cassette subfamily B protein
LIAAIYFTAQLGLQAGAIVVVFTYYTLVTRIFWEINRVYRNIESSVSEAAEFTQLFVDEPLVQDGAAARKLKVNRAAISFEQVDFKYAEQKDSVNTFLHDFNLEIPSGQKVGLIGPSGGGKTTITKLLLRFVDTDKGQIKIDGQDIKKITQHSLRRAIAYVPQEPLLFHRSLAENIAYGNEEATQDDVVKAAKLSRADEFISQLPQGYQTLVGERGIKLSGGQKQRVAIARAMIKNAPILVLDEATSSLDSESEKYIQEGLWELMKDKTALVIAHRLSTIKHLDRIIVLDNGKIVQDGTHEQLLKKPGIYATLWNHQSGGFL